MTMTKAKSADGGDNVAEEDCWSCNCSGKETVGAV